VRSCGVRTNHSPKPGTAEQHCSLVVLVEPVEHRAGDGEDGLVVHGHREAAQHCVEPGGLWSVEPVVLEICLVDGLGELPQHRVGELEAAQDRLERALLHPVVHLVPEFDTAHVEGPGVRRHVAGAGDEDELRLRVDEPPDQPRRGRPVDVHAAARRPLHARSLAPRSAMACTAARAISRSGGGK
jgi:hypothetical protein